MNAIGRFGSWLTALVALSSVTAQRPGQPAQPEAWRFIAEQHDQDRDGVVTAAEYGRGAEAFARLDRDGDGRITAQDFALPMRRAAAGRARGVGTRVGDPAPDFDLPRLARQQSAGSEPATSDATLRLSSFAGKRPVALIFGSWT
ncbi:MAG: hypothetical protein HZB39_04380 [Planctomycetes bacterium]|nr:hypothetical protein [Planctomycetota bacterium]